MGLVCGGENVLLVANGLDGILWNHGRRLFSGAKGCKTYADIHTYLEDLSGII